MFVHDCLIKFAQLCQSVGSQLETVLSEHCLFLIIDHLYLNIQSQTIIRLSLGQNIEFLVDYHDAIGYLAGKDEDQDEIGREDQGN